MGDRITGFKKVNEISATRKAANRHCTRVLLKSADQSPAKPSTTDSEMDKALLKAAILLTDVEKKYVAGLEEDKMEAFLKKSAEDRKPELDAFETEEKAKADAAARDEAEKAKRAAGDPEVVKLKHDVATLEARLADKEKAERLRDLEKTAKTDYPHVPNALDVLKSVDKLDEAGRAPILQALKSQNDLAGRTVMMHSGRTTNVEGSAASKLKAVQKAFASEHKVSEGEALLRISDMPEHQELISEVRREEMDVAA